MRLPTSIPLHERISMMRSSSSTADNPIPRIVDQHKGEPDPIKREKAMVKALLNHYFTSEAGFRVRLDEHQPTISYRDDEGAVVHLPSSHVMLHRVERADTINVEGKGKIHTLSLYAHCKPSEGLFASCNHILKGKDQAGEFANPKGVFAILHMGHEVSFFQYGEEV